MIADFDPCGCPGPPGPGALVKTGTGTMILSGLNTYSGGTTFAGGIVSVSQEANLGAAAGPLTFNGGILQITGTSFNATSRTITWGTNGGGFDIANAANTFTVTQNLVGGGPLAKFGAGTLVLTGTNTYTGGTTVNAGTLGITNGNAIGTGLLALAEGTTLRLDGTFALANNITVAGDPFFDVTVGNTATLNGTISDASAPAPFGVVEKVGAGTLVLAGTNTYSGGTVISAGTLDVRNNSSVGTGKVTLDGGTFLAGANNLTFVNPFAINTSGGAIDTGANTLTVSGAITDGNGPGALTKTGTGTLVLTNSNTYTGGTTISAGTLQLGDGGTAGSILGDVLNNGTFAINRSDMFVFGNVISGTGALQQNGTGMTVLTNTSTYTGATVVNSGGLFVNGSIASSSGLTVNPGGMVGGTGTLPNTTISGGALSPGNSIGTITVNGSLTFVGPGNYIVEVSPSAADHTNVTGGRAPRLAGSAECDRYRRLVYVGRSTRSSTTTGGVSGTFGDLAISGNLRHHSSRTSSTTPTTSTWCSNRSRSASLRRRYAEPARGRGARSTRRCGRQPVRAVPRAVQSFSRRSLPARSMQLSGEVHASTAGVLVDESLYPRSAVLGRLRQASYGGDASMASLSVGGPQAFAGGEELSALAYGKSPIVTKAPRMVPPASYDVTFWAQGFGARGKFDGDGNATDVRRDLAGFFSGVDTRVGTGGRVGIATGYTGSKYALNGRGSGNVETGHLMGYGGWSFGALNLRAGGAVAWHTIDTNRSVAFPGFFDSLTANYNGRTGQIFGEAGYGFAFGNVAVEPFAGAAFVSLTTDAANERGGPAALAIAANSFDVGYSTLGIRAASMIPLAYDMMLVPRASLAWQHAFNDVTPDARLAFIAAPAPFVISETM